MVLQEEQQVHFAAAQQPPPGVEADQPLSTSGCQLFWCQDSFRPSTEPVQQPHARLVTRLSPDSAHVAVPQQWPHPLVQLPDPDQLRRYVAMLKKLVKIVTAMEFTSGLKRLADCQTHTHLEIQCSMASSTFGRNIHAVLHWRVTKLCLWDGFDAQSRSLSSERSCHQQRMMPS